MGRKLADTGGTPADFARAIEHAEDELGVTEKTSAHYEAQIAGLEAQMGALNDALNVATERVNRLEADVNNEREHWRSASLRARNAEALNVLQRPLLLHLMQTAEKEDE